MTKVLKTSAAGSKGFTILEVLIAMAIFSIGILGVAKLQMNSTSHNTDSRLYTERASDAAGSIEWLMNTDYDDAQLNGGTTSTQSFDRYDMVQSVTAQVTDPDITDSHDIDTIKRIDITVRSKSDNEVLFTTTYYRAVTY